MRLALKCAKVDLQLSGYTHDGHTFFLKPLIALFNSGNIAGLYKLGAMKFHVSSGTGLWPGFSYRIGIPAEITRIVLRSDEVQDDKFKS